MSDSPIIPRPILTRRNLLRAGVLGAGGLALSGCDRLNGSPGFRSLIGGAETLHMRSQRLLVGDALAREYAEADMSPVFRANGNRELRDSAYLQHTATGFTQWTLAVDGLVAKPLALPLTALKALPQRAQITRHDCVEGWSCIAKWTGVPLGQVLAEARPLPMARFAVFHCHDVIERGLSGVVTYYESIDMIDAFHPQTILAYGMNGRPLPVANGAPLRVRVERQLGYKMAKYVHTIELVESFTTFGAGRGSYWADRGYDWYAGI